MSIRVNTTQEELASKIVDTALFVLQTRQLSIVQQQTLVTFVAETVGLEESDAQMLVQHELIQSIETFYLSKNRLHSK